ncbi:MAG TPA: nuclear transport factor 2 family protein [Anaeromyxobacteraceae bacterium]|nr:nuclear transport factor 2 family protein [Anaeromyxobacteraceae bacterium]
MVLGSRLVIATAVVATLAGCGSKRIPGTDIRDTRDTRAIVSVIDQYRIAAERRDADGVLALVSTRYFDDAGTADPADDQDYEQLRKRLPDDYARLTSVKLGMGVKAIDVTGDTATADVFFDGHWRLATKSGEVPKQTSDVNRMKFVREDGAWRIVSGL